MRLQVFVSPHCGACEAFKPNLVGLPVTFVDVEADDWELADELDIFGVPAVVVYDDAGHVVHKHVGYLSKPRLLELLHSGT